MRDKAIPDTEEAMVELVSEVDRRVRERVCDQNT
jgi:hypothetical protein